MNLGKSLCRPVCHSGSFARLIAYSIETVSRTFTKLKAEGLIALPTPNRVEIRNRDALEDFAAGQAGSDF